MAAWLAYAASTGALLVVLAVALGLLVESSALSAWLAAGIAWPVQLLAFGALVAGRSRGTGFMASWAGGMALRFAVIAGVAFWVTRSTSFDPATVLLSLVGFVFVLVVLEPLFLRLAD